MLCCTKIRVGVGVQKITFFVRCLFISLAVEDFKNYFTNIYLE